MMGDRRLSEDAGPLEFPSVPVSRGDEVQPGACQRQTGPGGAPDPPDAAPGGSASPGQARQAPQSSAQVVFWAGILQAQMCVLDLEEELEKAEGLRAELRRCLPAAPGHPGDLGGPGHSPPGEEGSSSPEDGAPGSSPEWGAEEEEDSMFFDNPLFLESPCSDTSVSGECFSWGFPDPQVLDTLQTPEPLLPEPREPSSELGLGASTAGRGGRATPPFPVPCYKAHPSCWASPTAPSGERERRPSLDQELGPASPTALTWEPLGSDLSLDTRPVQPGVPATPAGRQTGGGRSWPPEHPSQDGGKRGAASPQEPAPCLLVPGPRGSPGFSAEPSSPEPEPRGPRPPPSPAAPRGGSRSPGSLPPGPVGALQPSLLDARGAQPSPLAREDAPAPGPGVKAEASAGTAEATGAWPDVHLTAAEGLPESPMPQAQCPKEGQRTRAGGHLANGVGSDKAAWNLASRLYHLEGFRKSEVAAHLRKNNDFSRSVAEKYLTFFQFGGQSLDRALRGFLQALVLSGETQERERILLQFSRRFHACNPGAFPSADAVHTLTCAVMLLNTDLHGQNIGRSMSCQEFITNLKGLQDGGSFPKELLKALYWSIRSEKLEWAVDEADAARPEEARPSPTAAGKTSSPFLQLAQDPGAPAYKQGVLARKMHQDADGKRTPWGKRGWKVFHTLLRGMVLYFLKQGEEPCAEGEHLVGRMVDEPVGVHHSLATPAAHYTKKPHVFQLRTADWRLYLFQAPTAKEMASWIKRINLAAATHSAPPFPAAVGSQRRFVRPILPVGPARSSLEEQHRSHENCLDAASDDLLDLQRNLPERRGRSRDLEEYRLRKEYLEFEKARYETYVQLLMARLHCPSGDLTLWEEQLEREAGAAGEPKPSLKKSHSSPTLHQDEAPTTAKVKRNISERRTYRKIIPKRNRHQL